MATVKGNEEDLCAHCNHERGAHDDVWGCGAHEYHTNGDCNCHLFVDPNQYDDDHCLDCGHDRNEHNLRGCCAEVVVSWGKDEDNPKLGVCECEAFVERNENQPYTPDPRI